MLNNYSVQFDEAIRNLIREHFDRKPCVNWRISLQKAFVRSVVVVRSNLKILGNRRDYYVIGNVLGFTNADVFRPSLMSWVKGRRTLIVVSMHLYRKQGDHSSWCP